MEEVKPKIIIDYWIIGAGVLLLCLGLILGWRVGSLDGANVVGEVVCHEQHKGFIEVNKSYSVICTNFTTSTATAGVLPFD